MTANQKNHKTPNKAKTNVKLDSAIIRKKRVVIPIVILLVYTIAGFFLLPVISKKMITQKLSQALNRQVSVEKILINPFALTMTAKVFVIKDDKQNTIASFDRLFANISMASVFTLTPVVSELALETPFIRVTRNKDNTFNFSDLTVASKNREAASDKAEADDAPVPIPGLVLENLKISGGNVLFLDQMHDVSHQIEQFSVSVPFVSSKNKDRDQAVKMDIGFVLNKAKIDIDVSAKPFAADSASRVSVKTSAIDTLHYLPYVPLPKGLELKDLDFSLALIATYAKEPSGHKTSLRGSLSLLNAHLNGAQETLIRFPKLQIDLSPSDILSGNINISHVVLKSLIVDLKRDKSGVLNLMAYLPEKQAGDNPENTPDQASGKAPDQVSDQAPEQAPEQKNEKTGPDQTGESNSAFELAVSLDMLDIQDAAINYEDLANAQDFKTTLSPLNVTLKAVRIGKNSSGKYHIDFNTEQKERFASSGSFSLDPLKADGSITVTDFLPGRYTPYYGAYTDVDIKQGQVNLDTRFSVEQLAPDVDMKMDIKTFSILSLGIADRLNNEDLIVIPEFSVLGSTFDLQNRDIRIGDIQTKGGKIFVQRLKDGQFNFMPVKSDPATASAPSPEKVQEPSPLPSNGEEAPAARNTERHAAWKVAMTSLDMSGFSFGFKDLFPQDPVDLALSDISIKASGLKSYGSDAGSIDIGMNWNTGGRISIKGDLVPAGLSTKLDISLDKIDIKSVQPYFTQDIKILVTDGNINTSGTLLMNLADTDKRQLKFSGQASVTDFVSLDKKSAKEFFKCNSLYLSGVDFDLFPAAVSIKDISLTDFYSRIIIDNSGEMNLTSIFNSDAGQPSGQAQEPVQDQEQDTRIEKEIKPGSQKKSDAGIPVKVDSITLQGGNISFSDYLTQPNFTAGMKDIAGSVKGLSSEEKARAKLHLKGVHGQSSPLEIVGTINPLANTKFADIDVTFRDIELASFTPYSSKFLGYKIAKGKLILDLEYLIDGKKLQSQNKVKFDDFTLGDRVESESATSLPISLAVSLLKNPAGQIDLDLPVSGELDDPEFKVGSIVFKMISNLILKVVTSPFSVIGAMFGGGEELGYIEFEYGSADLDDAHRKKLDTLAGILIEKPSVKLDIQGRYHLLKDAQTLKEMAFNNLLKGEKLKQMVAQGLNTGKLEEVTVSSEEMAALIDSAYAQAQFPKPREPSGAEKILDTDEKSKLLITSITISTDDLRLLAMERSETIKNYLVTASPVEKERVFVLEPKGIEASAGNKIKTTFSLK